MTNHAPMLTNPLPDLRAVAGTRLSNTITAFADEDVNDKLSYTATLADGSALPAWLKFDTRTHIFSGTPSKNDVGVSMDILVTAKDKANASVSDVFHLAIVSDLHTVTVTNLNDSGTGSLRDALFYAQDGDAISFAPSLNGGTIYLTSTLTIDKSVTIDGDLNNNHIPDIALSGDANKNDIADAGDVRLLNVSAGINASLYGVILSHGYEEGAAGYNGVNGESGWGTYSKDYFYSGKEGYAGDAGGNGANAVAGIFNEGSLILTDSLITQNTAIGGAGGQGGTGGNGSPGGFYKFFWWQDYWNQGADGKGGVGGNGGDGGNAIAGIYSLGNLTISNVSVSDNQAIAGTGGFGGTGGLTGGNIYKPVSNGYSGYAGIAISDLEVGNGAVTNFNTPVTFTHSITALNALTNQPLNLNLGLTGIDIGETLTWNTTGLPQGISLDTAQNALIGTPTQSGHGTLLLHVEDGRGGWDELSLPWRVTTADLLNQTAQEDAAFRYAVPRGAFSDMGGILSYTAHLADGTVLPTWLKFTGGVFSGTAQNANVGAYNIVVTATDSKGQSYTDNFVLTVANTNDAPTLAHPIAIQTATEDAAFSFTAPTDTFTDVDVGDHLSYTATKADGTTLPTWLHFDVTTLTFAGTPANNDVGLLKLSLIATDSAGSQVKNGFSINVLNTNDAPILANAIADQNATMGSHFNFTLPSNSFSDSDIGDRLSYAASLSDGSSLPTWLSFDARLHKFSGTPNNLNLAPLDVRVTVTDKADLSVSDEFHISITDNHIALGSVAINQLYGSDSVKAMSIMSVDSIGSHDANNVIQLTGVTSLTANNFTF